MGALESKGARIRCATPLEAVELPEGGGVRVQAGGEHYSFDRVVSTIPTRALQAVAPELELPARDPNNRPKFLGVIRLALVLNRGLTPYYVTNLIQPGMPFTGIIELSSLADPKEFGGHGFVMLPRYDVPGSEWFGKPDEEVFDSFVSALKPMWPDLPDRVRHWCVHREPVVQALWISTPPPASPWSTPDGRLWNINAELAGRDTLNNNAIVKVANELYPLVLDGAAAPHVSTGREGAQT